MTRPDEVLETSLQFLKGVGPRKAADFARAGLLTDRRSAVSLPAPLRGSQPAAADRRAPRGPDRVDRRRDRPVRAPADAAAGLQDLRSARPRRQRRGARRLVQLAVPARRDPPAPAGRALRDARAQSVRRPAAHQPGLRAARGRRGRHAAHRPHRAGLRAGGIGHAEDAAAARARGARSGCRRTSPIRCPTAVRARRCSCRAAREALLGGALPGRRHAARRAERVPTAGAAAADLRGVLPVPARAAAAAARVGRRAQAARDPSSTTRSASRRGACCRSS